MTHSEPLLPESREALAGELALGILEGVHDHGGRERAQRRSDVARDGDVHLEEVGEEPPDRGPQHLPNEDMVVPIYG